MRRVIVYQPINKFDGLATNISSNLHCFLFYRDSRGDGSFMERRSNFTPYPLPATRSQSITPSAATCRETAGVADGETNQDAAPCFDNGENIDVCSTRDQVHAWYSAAEHDGREDGNVSVLSSPYFEEPTEAAAKCAKVEDNTNKRDGCVERSVTFRGKCSRRESVPEPGVVKVWHRPPPEINPFVTLENIGL